MIGDSYNETNFPHKLFTDRLVSRLCKAFANNQAAYKKLSKTHLSTMVPLGGISPLH